MSFGEIEEEQRERTSRERWGNRSIDEKRKSERKTLARRLEQKKKRAFSGLDPGVGDEESSLTIATLRRAKERSREKAFSFFAKRSQSSQSSLT